MSRYPVHPVAELFPLLEGDELTEMAESIGRHGLLHPIVLHEGRIVDGRNRLRACELAHVEPSFTEWTGKGDPGDWIVATNLQRRHLNPSQRALIALELKKVYETQAQERMLAGTALAPSEASAAPDSETNTVGDPAPPAEDSRVELRFKGKASEQAARATGVSARTIERAEQLVATAVPELVDAVRAGEASVNAAVEVAKLPKAQQVAVTRDKKVTQTARAIRGDFSPRPPAPPPVIPPVNPDVALNILDFKAEYKRGPAIGSRRPIHEVYRLEQIVATVGLAERAWRWINAEWDTDQREDLTFAAQEAPSMTPLLVEFRERLASIVARCRNDGRAVEDP